jgi:hypothetical protein
LYLTGNTLRLRYKAQPVNVENIENDASNNSSIVAYIFVTAVTFLSSLCLATIRGIHRHIHTDSSVIS